MTPTHPTMLMFSLLFPAPVLLFPRRYLGLCLNVMGRAWTSGLTPPTKLCGLLLGMWTRGWGQYRHGGRLGQLRPASWVPGIWPRSRETRLRVGMSPWPCGLLTPWGRSHHQRDKSGHTRSTICLGLKEKLSSTSFWNKIWKGHKWGKTSQRAWCHRGYYFLHTKKQNNNDLCVHSYGKKIKNKDLHFRKAKCQNGWRDLGEVGVC